jgi:hypothetical protein
MARPLAAMTMVSLEGTAMGLVVVLMNSSYLSNMDLTRHY